MIIFRKLQLFFVSQNTVFLSSKTTVLLLSQSRDFKFAKSHFCLFCKIWFCSIYKIHLCFFPKITVFLILQITVFPISQYTVFLFAKYSFLITHSNVCETIYFGNKAAHQSKYENSDVLYTCLSILLATFNCQVRGTSVPTQAIQHDLLVKQVKP